MMNKIELFSFDDNTIVSLHAEDDDFHFDDLVDIVIAVNNNEILLTRDILGYVIKELKWHLTSETSRELCNVFYDKEIGWAQNEYFHCIDEELKLDKPWLREIKNDWIGTPYNCFVGKANSTWIYRKGGKFFFKVTPLYEKHFSENENDTLYDDFIETYATLYENEIIEFNRVRCLSIIEAIEKSYAY